MSVQNKITGKLICKKYVYKAIYLKYDYTKNHGKL